jgi:hypothetical protein
MVWRQPWSAKIVVVQTQSMYELYATDSFIVLVEACILCVEFISVENFTRLLTSLRATVCVCSDLTCLE